MRLAVLVPLLLFSVSAAAAPLKLDYVYTATHHERRVGDVVSPLPLEEPITVEGSVVVENTVLGGYVDVRLEQAYYSLGDMGETALTPPFASYLPTIDERGAEVTSVTLGTQDHLFGRTMWTAFNHSRGASYLRADGSEYTHSFFTVLSFASTPPSDPPYLTETDVLDMFRGLHGPPMVATFAEYVFVRDASGASWFESYQGTLELVGVHAIPEPGTNALLTIGLVGLGGLLQRRNRRVRRFACTRPIPALEQVA